MKNLLLVSTFALMCMLGVHTTVAVAHPTPPKSGTIKVAFVLSEGATVIDFTGPWDVFETVLLGDKRETEDANPFELYTVAPSKAPLHTSGSHRPGFTVTPDYDFADAPIPDIVVVGAQNGGPGFSEWLQKVHAQNRIIMSVCTGAFKLAKAGLLDGKDATTHHWFFDKFANQYPNVKLVRSVRYTQADPVLFTAGGEMSGMDLALHIVAEYFGTAEAQKTADRMEYQGTGWKSNQGISEATIPLWHEDWAGNTGSGLTIQIDFLYKGATLVSTTMQSVGSHVSEAPATLNIEGRKVSMTFAIAGHPATFTGTDNDADNILTGVYTQDGKSYPLTLVKGKRKSS